jgi:hypothetical protein
MPVCRGGGGEEGVNKWLAFSPGLHHTMINDLYEEPHTKKQSLRDGGNKKWPPPFFLCFFGPPPTLLTVGKVNNQKKFEERLLSVHMFICIFFK